MESSKIRDKDAVTIPIPSGVRHSFLHLLQELVAGGPQLRAILGIALEVGWEAAYIQWGVRGVGECTPPQPLASCWDNSEGSPSSIAPHRIS